MCSLVAVFTLFLFFHPSIGAATDCLESLHDVEQYVKSNPYNIESIDDGFFPPNQHPSFWVTVNYYFNTSDNEIPIHPASFEAQYNCSDYCDDCNRVYCDLVPDFQFYWAESPLLHYIEPSIMEALSSAIYMDFNNLTIHIVVPPICGDSLLKHTWILNTLTARLKQLSSVASRCKNQGFTKITLQDDYGHEEWKRITDKGWLNDDHLMMVLIMFSQYMMCFLVMCLVPAFLLKYFSLVPNTDSIATNRNHPMFSTFWGFTTGLVVFSIIHYIRELCAVNDLNVAFILFPVPSLIFLTGNLISARLQIPETNRWYIVTSVIITLCIQRVTFYIGWLVLTTIAFPNIIGLVIGEFMTYVGISLSVSAVITNFVRRRGSTHTCVLHAGSLITHSISCIIIVYQFTLATVGVDYHDGISAIMPSLAPILIIGLITWVAGKSRVSSVMWNQAMNGLVTFTNEEEIKLNLDEQDDEEKKRLLEEQDISNIV